MKKHPKNEDSYGRKADTNNEAIGKKPEFHRILIANDDLLKQVFT